MRFKFNPFTGSLDAVGGDATTALLNLLGTVANQAALPSSGNTIGDVRQAEDTGEFFVWDGTAWDGLGDFAGPPGPPGPASTDLLLVNLSGSQSVPTAANGIETFTFQWPAQILASALSADTAASGSAFEANARLNASSIYSVRPQIAVGSTTGSSGTLAITTAAAGDVLRFDISQAGGGCRLAKLYLTVRRNDA
jgi:hypothetical protein